MCDKSDLEMALMREEQWSQDCHLWGEMASPPSHLHLPTSPKALDAQGGGTLTLNHNGH